MTKKNIPFYKKKKYSVKYKNRNKTHKRGGNNLSKKSIDKINTPKTYSLTPESPLNHIESFNTSIPMSPILNSDSITTEKKTIATEKIKKFIKSSKKFLQIVCPNSGACISFGKYTKELNHFFKNFTHFEYAVSPIKSIGAVSENGFVKEIEYERDGYKAHAILKSSQTEDADNLVYEYLVGIKYVNNIIKSFPCFVETYGLYFYSKDDYWVKMKQDNLDKSILDHLELQKNLDYVRACQESKYAGILIQHINNAKTLQSMIKFVKFTYNELIYVLFIVYQALSSLSKTFTHYDLHLGNVLIYEPFPDKIIQYHYHKEDGSEISFYSHYIPKIIDYGRSYFDNGNLNSRKIYDRVCSINECKPNCGEDYGFQWLDPYPYLTISSSQKNESHDLRLMIDLSNVFNKYKINPPPQKKTYNKLVDIMNKIAYGVGIKEPENKKYGTIENLNISDSIINNVNGLHEQLKTIIQDPEIITENQTYYNNDKIACHLHIYYDQRPMVYERNI